MIKSLFYFLFLFSSELALAGATCTDIPGKQSHTPLKIKDGVVCFVEQIALDEQNNPADVKKVVYAIIQGHEPIKANNGELPSGGGYNSEKIVDAFTLDIDQDGKDEVVVIQFVEVRSTLAEPNSSRKFYDVNIFSQEETNLTRNIRASEWFGHAYSWFSDGRKIIYKFPYMTQQSIRNALTSPFASLMIRDETIPVIVKYKSFLYEHSMVYGKPKKYLIAGDKATVDKYTAGWCRVNYTGGKQPL